MSKLYDDREARANGAVLQLMAAFGDIDKRGKLRFNVDEYITAIHTIQAFIHQHLLHRLDPDYFGDWWEQTTTLKHED